MRPTTGTTPSTPAAVRTGTRLARIITAPTVPTTWRPPVRLVGWLEHLRGPSLVAA